MTPLERCRMEQAACAAYLRGEGHDKAGALRGAADWLLEEALILAQGDSEAE